MKCEVTVIRFFLSYHAKLILAVSKFLPNTKSIPASQQWSLVLCDDRPVIISLKKLWEDVFTGDLIYREIYSFHQWCLHYLQHAVWTLWHCLIQSNSLNLTKKIYNLHYIKKGHHGSLGSADKKKLCKKIPAWLTVL